MVARGIRDDLAILAAEEVMNDDDLYAINGVQVRQLRCIMDRLYHHKPLVGDERRDLANRMHAILGQIEHTGPLPPWNGPTG